MAVPSSPHGMAYRMWGDGMNCSDKIIPIKTGGQRKQIRGYVKRRRNKRKYEQLYPEKVMAWAALREARQSGLVKKQPCQICGRKKGVTAHHEDYYHPLDAVWACRDCHDVLDAGLRLVRESRHEAI